MLKHVVLVAKVITAAIIGMCANNTHADDVHKFIMLKSINSGRVLDRRACNDFCLESRKSGIRNTQEQFQ